MTTPSGPPQNGTPDRNSQPGSPKPPQVGGFHFPRWLGWAIFLALLAWNAFFLFGPQGTSSVEVPYSAFLSQAQANNVSTVIFNGQSVQGTFRSAVLWPPPATGSGTTGGAPGASAAAGSGASASTSPGAASPVPSAAAAVPVLYSAFTSVTPALGDPALLPILESNGVTITAQDDSGSSLIIGLLGTLLPIGLLIGFLVYSGRAMRRSQAGIFGFGGSKARLYDAEQPKITFTDVAGEDDAKVELAEVVDFLKAGDRYRKLGARLPRGVLLIGPPGTGKTLLARAVAGEAQTPFFSISASEFVELFVGVGASRVRDLFAKAKAAAPAIVFVDEIDAVGRQRGTGLGGGNDEREQTLNQLLVEMDGFDEATNVIVIAATNRPDVLDPALLRPGRFDRQVTVGYPDRVGREAILKIHTRKLPLGPDVDLAGLARATPGFSGADLANLANEAALLAARKNLEVVGRAEFEEALDTVILGTRQAGLTNENERRTVAYHEAGHAVVARLTPGADPVQKITIVPHGQALGVTQQRPDDDRRNYPRDYLVGRLAGMLGGRAAEEIVFGEPTSGAESDLKAATSLARRMVGLWGMSEDVGPVSYGVGETQPFLGREMAAPREYAESTAARIDAAVLELINTAHLRATAVLTGHRAGLDAVAAELTAHEVVDGPRLDELLIGSGALPTPTPPDEVGVPVVDLPPPGPGALGVPATGAPGATGLAGVSGPPGASAAPFQVPIGSSAAFDGGTEATPAPPPGATPTGR